MFNEGGLWQQVQSGELQERLLKSGHPTPAPAAEPYCTRSQMVGYYKATGGRVALVHQYLRPDGTVGASGRPDPKALVVDGVLYTAV
jgi:hypothetical protein